MKVAELRAALQEHGLATDGLKNELVARLQRARRPSLVSAARVPPPVLHMRTPNVIPVSCLWTPMFSGHEPSSHPRIILGLQHHAGRIWRPR